MIGRVRDLVLIESSLRFPSQLSLSFPLIVEYYIGTQAYTHTYIGKRLGKSRGEGSSFYSGFHPRDKGLIE
jgi:hypothetical protein